MMKQKKTSHTISRRRALSTGLLASLGAFGGFAYPAGSRESAASRAGTQEKLPFRISLNTSTLMAYELPVTEQIDLVAAAGFDGIELWMRDVTAFLDKGGNSAQLKEQLQGHGLVLENMIGFSQWCSDDAEERKKALEQLQNDMGIIAALGGQYIAAPVMGIPSLDRAKYGEYAARYVAILDLEKETGVTPILEVWGAGALNTLADCAQIVIASGHPKATMLLDFYHLYRGGSDWDTLDCINAGRLPVIHMNDYPPAPAREMLTDAHRLLPGEGVCPFDTVIPKLFEAGFRGAFSVELFNKEYWASMDAKTMLQNSYGKTYAVLEKALSAYR